MDATALLAALLLGFVEGVTEFLPVSSTGHLILASELVAMPGEERVKTFNIFIQLGAILAVLWDRRASLDVKQAAFWRLVPLLAVAFLPAALLGLLTHKQIKAHLFNGTVVAWALIAGAVAIVLVETWPPRVRVATVADMGIRHALLIGLAQCLSLVPGVSRAAATILGGMVAGLGRPAATEFSFLLAIPTIGAASLYDLWSSRAHLGAADAPVFAVGFLVSFVVALLVVRWLLGYVRRHDFRPFALWRLVVGIAVLALAD